MNIRSSMATFKIGFSTLTVLLISSHAVAGEFKECPIAANTATKKYILMQPGSLVEVGTSNLVLCFDTEEAATKAGYSKR